METNQNIYIYIHTYKLSLPPQTSVFANPLHHTNKVLAIQTHFVLRESLETKNLIFVNVTDY